VYSVTFVKSDHFFVAAIVSLAVVLVILVVHALATAGH
jgi:hypothetical protein